MKIVFYNHYHLGDLFVSKEFVRSLAQQIPNCEYWHLNHSRALLDLPVTTNKLTDVLDDQSKFIIKNDSLYVNTWVGAYDYSEEAAPRYCGGINLKNIHDIWRYIFINCQNTLQQPLSFSEDLRLYWPKINCETPQVTLPSGLKVLFSNGAAQSGQSDVGNWRIGIENLAHKFPDVTFICTTPFGTTIKNILFTNNLLNTEITEKPAPWNPSGICDINEIAKLSTRCDIIIGKNSGPFIYCLHQDNVLDPNKHFIAFNRNPIDQLYYGISTPAKYEYHSLDDIMKFNSIISEVINKKS